MPDSPSPKHNATTQASSHTVREEKAEASEGREPLNEHGKNHGTVTGSPPLAGLARLFGKSPDSRPRRFALCGLFWGGVVGLLAVAWYQIRPRIGLPPGVVFSGAPQGTDQYLYMAIVHAIRRSPNGITYAYPFCLYWPAPPILLQLPLTVIAWISRLTGIPAAFEVGRVLGVAASGAGLALLARRLVRRNWRAWFLVALVLGGGWFWVGTIVEGLRISGLDSFTELWAYHYYSFGPLYYWAPFLAQNLRYPLETIYHGIVFLALAALVWRRYRTALALGLVAWFSNPFTALALSAAVLPWWAWRSIRSSGSERRLCAAHLAGWGCVVALGVSYYGPFLGHWPALHNLSELYANPCQGSPSPLQLILLWGPWIVGLGWSIGTKAGRRRVWGRPAWSLFAILALSQIALAQQGWILGSRAVQPLHYNRGYLLVALVVLSWRAAMTWTRGRRTLPRWLAIVVLLTVPDQALFFIRQAAQDQVPGLVSTDVAALVHRLRDLPPGGVTCTQAWIGGYLAAFSDQVPFDIPRILVVPFPRERRRLLDQAIREGKDPASMGIRTALILSSDPILPVLQSHGWRLLESRGDWKLLAPAASKSSPVPRFPPPSKPYSLKNTP